MIRLKNLLSEGSIIKFPGAGSSKQIKIQGDASTPIYYNYKYFDTRTKTEAIGSRANYIVQNNNGDRYPNGTINISSRNNKPLHPTQKPVTLMEYLIKTYTNENETVLDFTMGSGSTGLACKNLNRGFIGIELDETYFKIAEDRIKEQTQ